VELAITEDLLKKIIKIQRTEQTEYFVYRNLAKSFNGTPTEDLLNRIANDESAHHNFWKKYTKKEVKPNKFIIWFYSFLGRFLGLTFSIKLMEKSEKRAQELYSQIVEQIPEAKKIIAEEETHENTLISLIDEDKLKYAGAIVLGLNDALVELTGALAGLTFVLQNTRIIALAGLITGIAASFSMSASSYLSARADSQGKGYLKSAIYTGLAYILTVIMLVAPYLLFSNPFFALIITFAVAIFIIFCFNFYISVAKDYSFKSRFLEMILINLAVTGITFLIGISVREILGIDI